MANWLRTLLAHNENYGSGLPTGDIGPHYPFFSTTEENLGETRRTCFGCLFLSFFLCFFLIHLFLHLLVVWEVQRINFLSFLIFLLN